jgi:hypothetical protein
MAIAAGVDFISLSFVKSAGEIKNLKSYVESRAERRIDIIAKVGGLEWINGWVGRTEGARGRHLLTRIAAIGA